MRQGRLLQWCAADPVHMRGLILRRGKKKRKKTAKVLTRTDSSLLSTLPVPFEFHICTGRGLTPSPETILQEHSSANASPFLWAREDWRTHFKYNSQNLGIIRKDGTRRDDGNSKHKHTCNNSVHAKYSQKGVRLTGLNGEQF